ncbi:unnamed protein product [Ciceribacter selenitireducens ATCC BAA-1503]|uniref:Uncharacterized protein n=1 Tax=Ciceribacter selenitireducens ATCC BAA-1503 TaxID=1336235 RepID=A0A376A9F4_9HYPH|nr:unnamed protein product [Ciceribacter selenitireducens ATCC BAA-1503]
MRAAEHGLRLKIVSTSVADKSIAAAWTGGYASPSPVPANR